MPWLPWPLASLASLAWSCRSWWQTVGTYCAGWPPGHPVHPVSPPALPPSLPPSLPRTSSSGHPVPSHRYKHARGCVASQTARANTNTTPDLFRRLRPLYRSLNPLSASSCLRHSSALAFSASRYTSYPYPPFTNSLVSLLSLLHFFFPPLFLLRFSSFLSSHFFFIIFILPFVSFAPLSLPFPYISYAFFFCIRSHRKHTHMTHTVTSRS